MKLIAVMLLSALLLTGCGAAGGEADFRQVDTKTAVSMMEESEGFLILDVRTPEEFAAGHIPGAVNVPNETIGTTAPEALPDRDQTIFVYCRSGNRSKQASKKLAALGYTNIVEFGGINSWTGELEGS